MTEGPRRLRPAIEAHQAVAARTEPKRSAAVLCNRPDTRRELNVFVALHLSCSPVNPVQAALRTNPQDSLAVFICRSDRTVYIAIFVAEHFFVLERFHERFAGRVIPRIALARHADIDAVGFEQIRVIVAGVLRAAVGMMHQAGPNGATR